MGKSSKHIHLTMNKFVVPFLVCSASVTQAQLKFGGGGSSSSSSGSSSSNNKQSGDNKDVDTRFISTGSELIDGGILGVGAGLLGGAVLSGAFNQPNNNPCGRRRRRQADGKDGGDTRFFLPNLGGGGGCNCGRRKRRQAPHEDDAGTRFFGLENLLGGGSNCGCNCGYNNGGYNNGYNNGGYNNGGYNNGGNNYQVQCQCNNQLTFRDKYGNTHGACRRADETGRTWCYTYGGCPDSRPSKRFPNNPWSYQACNQYSG